MKRAAMDFSWRPTAGRRAASVYDRAGPAGATPSKEKAVWLVQHMPAHVARNLQRRRNG
jgi:hypothetical protein